MRGSAWSDLAAELSQQGRRGAARGRSRRGPRRSLDPRPAPTRTFPHARPHHRAVPPGRSPARAGRAPHCADPARSRGVGAHPPVDAPRRPDRAAFPLWPPVYLVCTGPSNKPVDFFSSSRHRRDHCDRRRPSGVAVKEPTGLCRDRCQRRSDGRSARRRGPTGLGPPLNLRWGMRRGQPRCREYSSPIAPLWRPSSLVPRELSIQAPSGPSVDEDSSMGPLTCSDCLSRSPTATSFCIAPRYTRIALRCNEGR
jgi:hypothetical protein